MKSLRSALLSILLVMLCFTNPVLADSIQTPPFEVEAVAAVLFDFESGQVLYSQKGRETHVPASLVKIMTLYVALDQISSGRAGLTETTTVGERSWRQSGSKMFLEPGEQVTIEQLLFGVAVVSGNDACVALAEALAGTESLYVQWMNDKAKSLGLDLQFVDVHGLANENKVTAESIALLVSSYLRDHPEAIEYHRQPTFSYQPRSSATPIVQNNRNGLLRTYEGADGLKTGHLAAAGYNLVGTAVQNNRRLIAVVLGAEGETAREREAAKLLDYGYRSFDLVNISRLVHTRTAKVIKGRKNSVPVSITEPLISVPRGIEQEVRVGMQMETLEAPVKKGQPVGTLSIFVGEELAKQVPLLAAEDVNRGHFFRVLWDSIIQFFQNLFKKAR